MRLLPCLFFVFLVGSSLSACTRSSQNHTGLLNRWWGSGALRVGLATDTPPLSYKQDAASQTAGLEIRFAVELAASMGKELQVLSVPRSALLQALKAKKVDIVMGGLTVAEIQANQMEASNSYLMSGQVALVHLDDYQRLGIGTTNLGAKNVRLGVVEGSAGDAMLTTLSPLGQTTRFAAAETGVNALLANKIDAFIYDMPTNDYYAARFVAQGLTPGSTLLTHEPLAWALRPGDERLRVAANEYLAALEQSGKLQPMLSQTIPFFRNTTYSPKP